MGLGPCTLTLFQDYSPTPLLVATINLILPNICHGSLQAQTWKVHSWTKCQDVPPFSPNWVSCSSSSASGSCQGLWNAPQASNIQTLKGQQSFLDLAVGRPSITTGGMTAGHSFPKSPTKFFPSHKHSLKFKHVVLLRIARQFGELSAWDPSFLVSAGLLWRYLHQSIQNPESPGHLDHPWT